MHSIILQYCRPNANVRIPLTYQYPSTKWSSTLPPCIIINGDCRSTNNILIKNNRSFYRDRFFRAIFVMYGQAKQIIKKFILQ